MVIAPPSHPRRSALAAAEAGRAAAGPASTPRTMPRCELRQEVVDVCHGSFACSLVRLGGSDQPTPVGCACAGAPEASRSSGPSARPCTPASWCYHKCVAHTIDPSGDLWPSQGIVDMVEVMKMLMRTDPFRELDRMAQQAFGAVGTLARPAVMPIDAWREEDTFVVELDLPGVTPDSIDLDVERNVLTVKAERRGPSNDDASSSRRNVPVASSAGSSSSGTRSTPSTSRPTTSTGCCVCASRSRRGPSPARSRSSTAAPPSARPSRPERTGSVWSRPPARWLCRPRTRTWPTPSSRSSSRTPTCSAAEFDAIVEGAWNGSRRAGQEPAARRAGPRMPAPRFSGCGATPTQAPPRSPGPRVRSPPAG